jgi:hypothetical protein
MSYLQIEMHQNIRRKKKCVEIWEFGIFGQ